MNQENNDSPWIQHKDDRNCNNCFHCKVVPESLKPKKNSRGYKYVSGKMRCKLGYWLRGICGEKEKFMAFYNNQWNESEFLKEMAENCRDFELMD
jgi:hypothetical protein